MLYASSSLSLACLEVLVHVRETRLPLDYAWVQIDIPDDLVEQAEKLPDANDLPACQWFGAQWIAFGATPVLEVPSAVIPVETNLLIHLPRDEQKRIRFHEPEPFRFDPRLLKTGPRALD